MRPIAACAEIVVECTRVSQVTPESPGTPRAMVYGLYRALPGEPGFLATVAGGIASTDLTPASGCQDHTTSPSASVPFVNGTSASTASRPASVTTAKRPSSGTGRRGCKSDLGRARTEIFLQRGLDSPPKSRRSETPISNSQSHCANPPRAICPGLM